MSRIHLLKFLDRWFGAGLAHLLPRVQAPSTTMAPASILIIRPGGIGDASLLVPAIHALQERFSAVVIDVLAERRNAEAFALCPGLRRIYCYDHLSQLLAVLRNRYDVVIDTEQWYRLSAVVARFVRAPIKIGFATNQRRRLFTHPVPYDLEDYEVNSFLRLLPPLGITPEFSLGTAWLRVPESARKSASLLLGGEDPHPVVALFPGASIPEKLWGEERFRTVAQWCAEKRWRVVIVGGAGESSAGERIASGLSGALNLAARTNLTETAAVLERAAVVVSGDSGVLHIAAGLGRPTVSLFGPSSAVKWGPRGDKHVVLRPTDCPSCSRFGTTPACPQDVRCMREISVDEVTGAIRALVGPS